MLDAKASELLGTINRLCGEGFKIAEEEELLSRLSWAADGAELRAILRLLEERRYIDVQYAEEGVYCLSTLPEGRQYFERLADRAREKARRRREVWAFSALGAFLGSLAGGLLLFLLLSLARAI